MANPQKENGYTAIANEIMDALCRTRISGEARQVLDTIIRKTYGYRKKEDAIALSQIVEATRMNKTRVCHAINKLIEMNLIAKKGNERGEGNIFSFNKDFDSWKPLPKKATLLKTATIVAKNSNKPLPKIGHTKEINTKKKEIAATSAADKTKFNPLGAEIIKEFESVDPKNKTYYGNKTQRGACDYLLDQYGLEEILKRIRALEKTNKIPYFPKINSPNDLKEKWVKLQDSVDSMRAQSHKITRQTPNFIL